jgi:hypothetical protein
MCEKKFCGECKFRDDEGWCGNSKFLLCGRPHKSVTSFSNGSIDDNVLYQGTGLWVGKRFGCIFWEKKSVEERIITCHFCGSVNQKLDVELPEFNFSSVFVRCLNCGARGPRKLSVPEAITAWNRIGKIEDYEE